MQEMAFSAASSADVTTWQQLTLTGSTDAPTGNAGIGHQVARFFVTGTNNGASITLAVAFVENSRVIGYFTAPCTVTTREADVDGSGSGYIFDVAFAAGGTRDELDLLGQNDKVTAASGARNGNVLVYVGLPVLSAGTATVRVATTRAI